MKKNNFTTPEQSKRLLELGVPVDSADCFYTDRHMTIWVRSEFDKIDWYAKVGNIPFYTPCWSVGRLIEIMIICYKWDLLSCASFRIYMTDIISHNLINQLINDLSLKISRGEIDFSKLEE